MRRIVSNIYNFYLEGFKSMTIGKWLWLIIFIKLAIIFLVLKRFCFPDKLATEYDNDTDRAAAVRSSMLTNR